MFGSPKSNQPVTADSNPGLIKPLKPFTGTIGLAPAEPGLHSIKVRTAQDYGARIVARADYWLNAKP